MFLRLFRSAAHRPPACRSFKPELEVLEDRLLLNGTPPSDQLNSEVTLFNPDPGSVNLTVTSLKFGMDAVLLTDIYILATNAQLTPQGSAFLAASATYLKVADTSLNNALSSVVQPVVPLDAVFDDAIQGLNSATLSSAVQTFKTQIEQEQWGPAASTAVQAVTASPLTPLGLNLVSDVLAANLAEIQDEVDSDFSPATSCLTNCLNVAGI